MNNGSRRRGRRRYRVRYDRIIAVAVVLIVMILLLSSCVKGCSDKDKNKNKSESSQGSVVDNLETTDSIPATQPGGQPVTDAQGQTATQPSAGQTLSPEFTVQTVEYTQIYSGNLVLVNSMYPYKFQQGDTNIVTVFDNKNSYYAASDNVISLDSEAITQLNSLMEGYALNVVNDHVRVIGGYRTIEVQNDKYNNGKSRFQGGYSDYHTARSFDLGIFPDTGSSGHYKPEGVYAWLDENAAAYGFVVRFPEGKDSVTGEEARTYTYRYVGVPHAVYMKQNNLCLEEYTQQIKSYTQSNPLAVTSGTSVYQVYYVAANANAPTDVPVPSNLPYTISGNNVDGFVVTVTISQ